MSFTDGRLGSAVATTTTGTGLATWMQMIPNDIGKLATVVGIVLSLVLILSHVLKIRQDLREAALREALLIKQISAHPQEG
jgi:hypothetical protein